MERRTFLQQAAAAATLAGWKAASGQNTNGNTALTGAAALTPLPVVSTSNGIGRRKLGRADVEVSIVGVGGYNIGVSQLTEQDKHGFTFDTVQMPVMRSMNITKASARM
jgi:hypothetical protein